MGYGTNVKGYRLYDPTSGKRFYSRDCKLNETEFGPDKESIVEELIRYFVLDLPEVNEEDSSKEVVAKQPVSQVRKSEAETKLLWLVGINYY